MNKQALASQLDELEAALPKMIEASPDAGDFWCEFAGHADVIQEAAGDHCQFVHDRISAMLASHGRFMADVELREI